MIMVNASSRRRSIPGGLGHNAYQGEGLWALPLTIISRPALDKYFLGFYWERRAAFGFFCEPDLCRAFQNNPLFHLFGFVFYPRCRLACCRYIRLFLFATSFSYRRMWKYR